MDTNKLLLTLLTGAVRGGDGRSVLATPLSDEEIQALYNLSKKHDLSHLVGVALESVQSQDKQKYKPFYNEAVKAMYRYEWLRGEQNKICELLDRYSIPYIPLKGSVIRDLYREPWHRTSCDIDVLIPEERLDEAVAAFVSDLSYSRGNRSRHDVSLTAPNGVHFELHFDIDEIYVDREEFWTDSRLANGEGCRRILSDEMLLLSHIAHMAKHFVNGGCGIRPFLDLWLLRNKLKYDQAKLLQMIDSHGLTAFYVAVSGVVDVWFDKKEANDTERMVQAFILPAGVYGDLDNKISVVRSGGKSKFAYVFERIFLPRSLLKIKYPVLNKHSWLLSVCWVRRWMSFVFSGKFKKVKKEYDINRRIEAEKLSNTGKLLGRLGLNS